MILPFLLSSSGGSHLADNADELSAVIVTFSGGPSGAKNQSKQYECSKFAYTTSILKILALSALLLVF